MSRVPHDIDEVAIERAMNGLGPTGVNMAARHEAIRRLYTRRLTYGQIADRVRVSTRTVQRVIDRDRAAHGWRRPPSRVAQIQALIGDGLQLPAIARRLDVELRRVKKSVRDHKRRQARNTRPHTSEKIAC